MEEKIRYSRNAHNQERIRQLLENKHLYARYQYLTRKGKVRKTNSYISL